MVNKYYQEHAKRKKQVKAIKILLKKKNISDEKRLLKGIKVFTREEKEKRYQHYLERKKRLPDYKRN